MNTMILVSFGVLAFIALMLFLTEKSYRGDNPFAPFKKGTRRFHRQPPRR